MNLHAMLVMILPQHVVTSSYENTTVCRVAD